MYEQTCVDIFMNEKHKGLPRNTKWRERYRKGGWATKRTLHEATMRGMQITKKTIFVFTTQVRSHMKHVNNGMYTYTK